MTTMHMIGNAHLDPVWLWRWQDGFQEARATFRSALDRMNETDGFIFTCACAQYYQWVEESDPEMFCEIQQRVKEKKWAIVGGMWIQPDMNVPSGESVARHLMMSQRYFYEKFGIMAETGYNVDTFGHGATLPQLLGQAGIKNYVWMRPGMRENPNIPRGMMCWKGPDGTAVRAYRIPDEFGYCGSPTKERIEFLFDLAAETNQPVMCFYGAGNHGGGPTIEAISDIEAYIRDAERGSELAFSSPDIFFEAGKELELPVWESELQHHASGCYSTHWQSKKLNREVENALVRAEKFIVLAEKLTGHKPDRAALERAWKNVLFNQFHDIMGGCSIREGMEDAVISYNEALSIAQREENKALSAITWKIDTRQNDMSRVRSKNGHWMYWSAGKHGSPLVVFNPHPFEANGYIQLVGDATEVSDEKGNTVPMQIVRASRTNGTDKWDTLVQAQKLPPMGYRVYRVYTNEREKKPAYTTDLSVTETVLENSRIRAEFDKLSGALISLKLDGRECLAAPAQTRLFDITHSDTWAHMIFKFDQPAGAFGEASISIIDQGPVRASLLITTRFGQSVLRQMWSLGAYDDQLRVDATLFNFEKQRMIKFCLPTTAKEGKVLADIAYGSILRTPNGDEEPCQRYIAMGDDEGGVAILNSGKYSYSSLDGELRMTVAHSSIFADHYGQKTRDELCEYMDLGEQKYSLILRPFAGRADAAALCRAAEEMAQPIAHICDTWHEGTLPLEKSALTLSGLKLELGAMKPGEDGQSVILRLREVNGEAGCAHICLPLFGHSFDAEFKPFEIKTFYIPCDESKPVCETNFTEIIK